MSGVLLDTNVLSELAHGQPNAQVIAFCKTLPNAYISVITIHELYYGAMLLKGKRKNQLLDWIAGMETHFAGNILPLTAEVARIAGEMRASAVRKGRTLHVDDALIAATASNHSLSLVTRNIKDFETTVVSVVNPWG